MEPRYRKAAIAALFASAAVACLAPVAQAARGSHDAEDSNALIMTAEIALQRDDCGRASANYTIAAQRLADAKLAARAADVALDCGQYQAAERAAARWRVLVPSEPAALHAQMRNAARLYALSASWDAVFEGVYSTYDEVLASHGR